MITTKIKNIKIKNILLPLLLGFIFSFGILFPLELSPIAFLAAHVGFLGLLLLVERELSRRQLIFIFLFFSLTVFSRAFSWLNFTIAEYGFIPVPGNYLLALLFTPFLFPHFLAGLLLIHWLREKVPLFQPKLHPLSCIVFFSLLMVGMEEMIPQEFPAHMGHFWINLSPHLFAAPFIGATGYSFLSYLFLFALCFSIRYKKIFLAIAAMVTGLSFMVISWIYPLKLQHQNPLTLHTRIVQGNVGNYLKLTSEKGDPISLLQVVERYQRLSLQESSKPLDLIIWPETAFPYTIYSPEDGNHPHQIPQILYQIMEVTGAELLTGGYDQTRAEIPRDDLFETMYNAVFHFDLEKGLKTTYHKRHLIPFGETLPFGPLNTFLGKWITNVSYFAEGSKFELFTLKKSGARFSVVVCYEILFSSFILSMANSFPKTPIQFLVNVTNDSWFGDTAEPHQHLFLAKWRALELQIPIIRSTNTGITSILLPDGSESARTKMRQEEILDWDLVVEKNPEITFYQRFGVQSTFLLGILFLGIALFFETKKNKNL